MDFITALAEALCSEEVEQCQLACRGVVSQGERGMPRPCRGWKSLREWASMCVFVCVCVYPVLLCVCVCGCEQKAQVRDTERKDMLDLLTALWCVPPKKKKVLCN